LFPWYNNTHCHSGILFLTPSVVHSGRADATLQARHEGMMKAYSAHPERCRYQGSAHRGLECHLELLIILGVFEPPEPREISQGLVETIHH
jgi:hypothetical protein